MNKLDIAVAALKARSQTARDRRAALGSVQRNLIEAATRVAADITRHGMRLLISRDNELHLEGSDGTPLTVVTYEQDDDWFLLIKSDDKVLLRFDPLSIKDTYTEIHAVEEWLAMAVDELFPTPPSP